MACNSTLIQLLSVQPINAKYGMPEISDANIGLRTNLKVN